MDRVIAKALHDPGAERLWDYRNPEAFDLRSIHDDRMRLLAAAALGVRRRGSSPGDEDWDDRVVRLLAEAEGIFWPGINWPNDDCPEDVGASVREELRLLRAGDEDVTGTWTEDIVQFAVGLAAMFAPGGPHADAVDGYGDSAFDPDRLPGVVSALEHAGAIDTPLPDHRERSVLELQRSNPLRGRLVPASSVEPTDRPDLVDRWVPGGVPIMVTAREGVGKSTYCVAMACSIAARHAFLGSPVTTSAGCVLYLAYEDRIGIVSAIDAWRRQTGIEDGSERLLVPDLAELPSISDADFIAHLEGAILGYGISLVIVDTFADASNIDDEDNSVAITRFMRPVKRMCERTGCTVVFAHHATKGTGVYRGSTAIAAGMRAEHILTPGDHGRLSVKGGKWNVGLPPRAVPLRIVSPDGERGRGVIALDEKRLASDGVDDDLLLERMRDLGGSAPGEIRLIDLETFAESELGWPRGSNGRVSRLTNGWRERMLKANSIVEGSKSGWYSAL
jgi:hypothetical protein